LLHRDAEDIAIRTVTEFGSAWCTRPSLGNLWAPMTLTKEIRGTHKTKPAE